MQFLAAALAAVASLLSGGYTSAPVVHLPALIAPSVSAPQATILFGGDMIFDRSIRTAMNQKGPGYIFSCIDPYLENASLVVANLEGPITNNASVSVGSIAGAPDNFVFTFPTSTASLLYQHNIRMVNLGNNHILNYGTAGASSTMATLSNAGVSYFGDPLMHSVASGDINHVHLAFINYNEFSAKGQSALGGAASTTIAQIILAQQNGEVPIVYAHWGIEYATSAPAYVRTLAHQFVDAGAAIVIGSHPHVVEDHEIYHGAPIYYSLGNFIFDQYWNDSVDHGLLLSVTFSAYGVEALQEIPVELEKDQRTCPLLASSSQIAL